MLLEVVCTVHYAVVWQPLVGYQIWYLHSILLLSSECGGLGYLVHGVVVSGLYPAYCAVPGVSVECLACLCSWVGCDQDSIRAAGAASSLLRNVLLEEIGGYNTVRDMLRDVQVMLSQTVRASCIHLHEIGPIRAFTDLFQNHPASNIMTFSHHVTHNGALAPRKDVETAVHVMATREWARKAGGSFKPNCMFLIVKGACAVLEGSAFHFG